MLSLGGLVVILSLFFKLKINNLINHWCAGYFLREAHLKLCAGAICSYLILFTSRATVALLSVTSQDHILCSWK